MQAQFTLLNRMKGRALSLKPSFENRFMHVPEPSAAWARVRNSKAIPSYAMQETPLAPVSWRQICGIREPGAGGWYCGRHDDCDRIYHIDRG